MIQIGNWSGYYSFLNPEINKIRGFERTNFDIQIFNVAGNKFTGEIKDDLATGGTEGIGEIAGQINGNKVEFIKRMPVLTLLVDKDGTRKTLSVVGVTTNHLAGRFRSVKTPTEEKIIK